MITTHQTMSIPDLSPGIGEHGAVIDGNVCPDGTPDPTADKDLARTLDSLLTELTENDDLKKRLEALSQAFYRKVEVMISETLERLLAPAAEMEALKRKPYVTEEEAAKILSIAPSTMRTDRCRGAGPKYIKNGRKIIYSQQELVNYLERRRRQSKD